jgi:hypothetical protein
VGRDPLDAVDEETYVSKTGLQRVLLALCLVYSG